MKTLYQHSKFIVFVHSLLDVWGGAYGPARGLPGPQQSVCNMVAFWTLFEGFGSSFYVLAGSGNAVKPDPELFLSIVEEPTIRPHGQTEKISHMELHLTILQHMRNIWPVVNISCRKQLLCIVTACLRWYNRCFFQGPSAPAKDIFCMTSWALAALTSPLENKSVASLRNCCFLGTASAACMLLELMKLSDQSRLAPTAGTYSEPLFLRGSKYPNMAVLGPEDSDFNYLSLCP